MQIEEVEIEDLIKNVSIHLYPLQLREELMTSPWSILITQLLFPMSLSLVQKKKKKNTYRPRSIPLLFV